MNYAIDSMKGCCDGKVREVESRMNDMFNAFDNAIVAGVDENTLDEARKIHSAARLCRRRESRHLQIERTRSLGFSESAFFLRYSRNLLPFSRQPRFFDVPLSDA